MYRKKLSEINTLILIFIFFKVNIVCIFLSLLEIKFVFSNQRNGGFFLACEDFGGSFSDLFPLPVFFISGDQLAYTNSTF